MNFGHWIPSPRAFHSPDFGVIKMEAIFVSLSPQRGHNTTRMLRFSENLKSIAQAQREHLAPQCPPHMLMPLSLMLSSVRQDFDVPTSHLIGAHGYCTQVRRQWGPAEGKPASLPCPQLLPLFFISNTLQAAYMSLPLLGLTVMETWEESSACFPHLACFLLTGILRATGMQKRWNVSPT